MIKRCFLILSVFCLALAGPVRAAFDRSLSTPVPAGLTSTPLPGNLNLVSSLPSWIYLSSQDGSEMGYAVSTAGDVNGDGFSDVIVGAPKFSNGLVTREGVVFIFNGSPAGLGSTPTRTLASGQQGSYFGGALSVAGDINGDGYADIIIGAKTYNNGSSEEGAAFVYYGSPGGLDPTPTWTFYGGQKSVQFGASVSAAGDINGDGYADVIVGAPRYKEKYDREGAVFIFFGSESGLSTVPDLILTGGRTNAQFGYSLSSAGNVNGDGYSDVIIGAPYYSDQPESVGAVFLYTGSETGLEHALTIRADGSLSNALFGAAVSSAGDVNADGFDDVIIGAPNYTGYHEQEGAALVYLGSRDGLVETPAWMATGGKAFSGFGSSVASAGFINDDIFADILVGAPRYPDDNPENSAIKGKIYLFSGSPSGPSDLPDWTVEGKQSESQFGFSLSSAGDVNGNGFDDVLVGAYHYMYQTRKRGAAFAYYSGGGMGLDPFHIFLPMVAGSAQ